MFPRRKKLGFRALSDKGGNLVYILLEWWAMPTLQKAIALLIQSVDRTLQLLFVANIGINLRLVAVGVLVIKCLQEVKRRFRQTMAASICY